MKYYYFRPAFDSHVYGAAEKRADRYWRERKHAGMDSSTNRVRYNRESSCNGEIRPESGKRKVKTP